jgi:hypothetical protein
MRARTRRRALRAAVIAVGLLVAFTIMIGTLPPPPGPASSAPAATGAP